MAHPSPYVCHWHNHRSKLCDPQAFATGKLWPRRIQYLKTMGPGMRIEATIEQLVALFDEIDGDPDLEPDADAEPDADGEIEDGR